MDAEAIATERNCSLHVAGGMLLACQHCEVNVYCSAVSLTAHALHSESSPELMIAMLRQECYAAL